MRQIAFIFALVALAVTASARSSSQASAALAGSTLTLTDSTPTYTTPWGVVVHKGTITVARGTVVNVVLLGKTLPGYTWQVTAQQFTADCDGKPDQAQGNDFRCFPDGPTDPTLSASGTQYETTFTAPSVATTIRVDYAYFPPLKPGQTGNSAIKVFEAEVIVR